MMRRYLESTPGHTSSFEMWLNPSCVAWSVLSISSLDSCVLAATQWRSQIDAILKALLKIPEKIDDGRRGENSNDYEVQPTHRRTMAIGALYFPQP